MDELFIIKENERRMLAYRNYFPINEVPDISNLPYKEARAKFSEALYFNKEFNAYTLVLYSPDATTAVNSAALQKAHEIINRYYEQLNNPRFSGVYIYGEEIGSNARKVNVTALSKSYNVQFFSDEELSYCPFDSIYYRQHTLLTEQEKVNLLAELKVSINNLPFLYQDDIIVKWFNWPAGNIVRIDRHDPPGISYYDYRLITAQSRDE
jgi:DNA-directed RNA polymerase subunit H (RpoH/RPB5)